MKMFLLKDQSNPTSSSLYLVSSRKWKRHQSVDIPSYPRCLRNVGNKLYQCHNGGIAVYDVNLTQLKSIPNGYMDWVFDVCNIPNGDLLVAADKGLFHYKTNGGCKFRHSSAVSSHLLCYCFIINLHSVIDHRL